MSAALVWIILPLFFSLFLLLFRRNYRLSAWMQTAVCFALILLGIFSTTDPAVRTATQVLEFDAVFNILGRSLVIDSNLRNFSVILFAFLGFWTLALIIFKIQSRVVPLGIAFMAFLISALAVEPFLYSALLIEISVIVSVLMVADVNAESNNGVLRYLIYFSIGVPFVLLAGWYLAGGEITPVNEEQLIQATLLLGLGFVFWLGVFPFQSWIPLIAEENRLSESFLVLIIMPVAIMMLLLKYLNGFVWLREYGAVFQGLRIFGLLMVVSGSVWAFFQQKLNRLLSYLLIASTGTILLSIGLDLPAGIYLSSYLVFARLAACFILVWIAFALQQAKGDLSLGAFKSLFYLSPFMGLSALLAFFSFAGMPLTAGFPVMQSLYAYLAAANKLFAFAVIACTGVISMIFIRLSFLVLSRNQGRSQPPIELTSKEKITFITFAFFMIVAGLLPNIFFGGFERMVSGFEFLVK